jgi:hypothetical protein
MNDLLSYLFAQAERQPLRTLQFAAGEAWRRGRQRWVDSLEEGLPEFAGEISAARFLPFLPDFALQAADKLNTLPFSAATLERAARICRHDFEVFGEPVSFGTEIAWHRDWKPSYVWPLDLSGRLRVLDAPSGADVKRPWEIARFHHALDLGQAFAFTHDPAYAVEFAAQVRHWIRENPYPRGIHWAMPMEAAIRAANWITAAAFFAPAGWLAPELSRELLGSLFLHGRFIRAHREWNPVTRANHYLACVVGLLYLGALFRDLPEGRGWLDWARRELIAEMESQVGEDGVAREASSGYHAFVAEMFLDAGLLLVRLDGAPQGGVNELRGALQRSCGAAFVARLERMFDFLAALSAGRERPPIWGDSDDGRFLPFGGMQSSGAAGVVAVGRMSLGWPAAGAQDSPECFWRLGAMHPESRPPVGAAAVCTPLAEAFRDAGFFFFSSPRLRGSIRCGPLGAGGWSNHAHNDQLSIEVCCDGRAVIVDPGLPTYAGDPDARNLFRSTRYHNGVVVAAAEQNRFWPRLLFRIVDDTRSRLLDWQVGPEGVEFAGEHSGYQRLPQRAVVRRELRCDAVNDRLELRDTIQLHGAAPVEWFFHLAPGIEPQPLGDSAAPLPPAGAAAGDGALSWHSTWRIGPLILGVWTSLPPELLRARQEDGWVAPRYGQKVPAEILSFRAEASGSIRAAFVILPEDAPLMKERRA